MKDGIGNELQLGQPVCFKVTRRWSRAPLDNIYTCFDFGIFWGQKGAVNNTGVFLKFGYEFINMAGYQGNNIDDIVVKLTKNSMAVDQVIGLTNFQFIKLPALGYQDYYSLQSIQNIQNVPVLLNHMNRVVLPFCSDYAMQNPNTVKVPRLPPSEIPGVRNRH